VEFFPSSAFDNPLLKTALPSELLRCRESRQRRRDDSDSDDEEAHLSNSDSEASGRSSPGDRSPDGRTARSRAERYGRGSDEESDDDARLQEVRA
jgi:hypothetical protein